MKTVVRITRHEADADRIIELRRVFGEDVSIITNDIQFGDDPVLAVSECLARNQETVAIEVVAPFPILVKLVEAQRRLGVLILRAQFKREECGRAIVVGKDETGRDVLAFDHYEVIERIEFQTRRLEP